MTEHEEGQVSWTEKSFGMKTSCAETPREARKMGISLFKQERGTILVVVGTFFRVF